MVISVSFDPGADAAQALGREKEVGREVFQGDALHQLGIFAQHEAVLFAFVAPGIVGEIVLVAAQLLLGHAPSPVGQFDIPGEEGVHAGTRDAYQGRGLHRFDRLARQPAGLCAECRRCRVAFEREGDDDAFVLAHDIRAHRTLGHEADVRVALPLLDDDLLAGVLRQRGGLHEQARALVRECVAFGQYPCEIHAAKVRFFRQLRKSRLFRRWRKIFLPVCHVGITGFVTIYDIFSFSCGWHRI